VESAFDTFHSDKQPESWYASWTWAYIISRCGLIHI